MGKIWYLNFSYDEKADEYFAYVDDGTRHGVVVYQIDDTEEIIDYIQTGKMKHIDDVDGLAKFLIAQEFIAEGDVIKLNKEMLW